ncbi:MAG: hypothetical protein ACI3ZY_14680 [Parabacteroides sp.]
MNRPTIQQQGKSALEQLFMQLPEERLPIDFRAKLMREVIHQEAVRRKRNERLGWLALILASCALIALAAATLVYLNFSWPYFELFRGESFPFYGSIGVLALLLLLADYKLRRLYFSHKKM